MLYLWINFQPKSKHWREASTLLVDYSYNHVDPTQTNDFQIRNYKLYVWYLSYLLGMLNDYFYTKSSDMLNAKKKQHCEWISN